MQYRQAKNGDMISILGYGCMRFSRKMGSIDFDKAQAELLKGIRLGINYFDTAWLYPGSEALLGKVLKQNGLRESVFIATKLPQYMVRKASDFDKFFEEECRRLQTDYIDYYLMHMLPDVSRWESLCQMGVLEWIERKKREGRIRNVGFSFHGNSDLFMELLDAYDWDFCQIQYNYVDEHGQGGVKGLHKAHSMGIPVVIMEPLLGGKLATGLPKEAERALEAGGHGWSPAEWGLRWLWEQPEVACVLSGMNSMEMLQENVRVASEVAVGSFGERERQAIEQAKRAIEANIKVNCTGCRYCMPCSRGVDIPMIFNSYNESATDGKMGARMDYLQNVAFRENPGYATQCNQCGACERHCPQQLKIRDLLKEADAVLSPPYMKAGRAIVRKFVTAGKRKA